MSSHHTSLHLCCCHPRNTIFSPAVVRVRTCICVYVCVCVCLCFNVFVCGCVTLCSLILCVCWLAVSPQRGTGGRRQSGYPGIAHCALGNALGSPGWRPVGEEKKGVRRGGRHDEEESNEKWSIHEGCETGERGWREEVRRWELIRSITLLIRL